MGGLDRLEAELVDRIDLPPMVDRVERWSCVNSWTGNLEGLGEMAGLLAHDLATLPGELTRVAPRETSTVNASGDRVPVAAGDHLVLRVRPAAARRVLLTGHMDTVYPPDLPFREVERNEGRLHGPGVLDMKSGLAVMIAGLRAFEAAAPELGYDVLVNSDEETGSASSAALIDELSRDKIAALTYEPSLPGGALARSRPGSGNYAAVIRGRSAHAGRNPQDGRNAVVAAAALAVRLAGASRPGLSVNVARVDGGGPNNVVPALAVLRFNVRPRGPEEATEAKALIAAAVASIRAEHEVEVELAGGMGRPPKAVTAESEQLFALVARAGAALGQVLSWRDVGGVCDGNNIAACGVPVIDTMGACGDHIHSPSEYLEIGSLVPRAQLTALVLHRLAAGGMHP